MCERLMVCISPSPWSARLVRTAHRLAQDLRAEWDAVYVEGSVNQRLGEDSHKRLIQIMRLAEELGGKVVTIHGASIPETILRYANQHAITKIIIGHPAQSRWQEVFRGSIVHDLVRQNRDIDIFVIRSGLPEEQFSAYPNRRVQIAWGRYLKAGLIILLATAFGLLIQSTVFPATIVTLYLLGIMFSAGYLGYGPALMATLFSVLAFYLLFVPSEFTLTLGSVQYTAILGGMLISGIFIARLIAKALERADIANKRADQIMELYALSRDLAVTVDFDAIMQTLLTHTQQTFDADLALFLAHGTTLEKQAMTDNFPLNDDEMGAAEWAFKHGEPVGFSTTNLLSTACLYLPLKTAHQTIGVIGLAFASRDLPTLEQRRLMDAFAHQAALVLEASQLSETLQQAQLLREKEKLQTALLNSISHDLRTPLVSITGALSSLRDEAGLFDEANRQDLLDGAWHEADRLNRLVGNLLEMSRLQSGSMQLKREPYDVQEVIGVARSQLKERLQAHPVVTHIAPDVPLVPLDFVLMVQVMVNLLDNAVKYSPAGQPIDICAHVVEDTLILQVSDSGAGIPQAELDRVFGKFYRASNVMQKPGTGLGLSICEGIIEAHGGEISAKNKPAGGTVLQIRLPLEAMEQAV